MGKKYSPTVDLLKGICILLVILGHAIQRHSPNHGHNNMIYIFLSSFNMPMFFLLSGYVVSISKRNLNTEWIKRKFLRLIIPFFIWTIITYLFRNVYFTGLDVIEFPNNIFIYIINNMLYPVVKWYLWILFLCLLIYWITLKKFKKRSFGFFLLIFVILQIFPVDLFGIKLLKFYYLFFLIGLLLYKYKASSNKYKYGFYLSSIFLFPFLVSQWSFSSPLFYSQLQPSNIKDIVIFIYFYLTALTGSVIVYLVSNLICRSLKTIIIEIGKLSMELYMCHSLFLRVGFGNINERIASTFIFATFFSIFLSKIISKNKYLNLILFGNISKI